MAFKMDQTSSHRQERFSKTTSASALRITAPLAFRCSHPTLSSSDSPPKPSLTTLAWNIPYPSTPLYGINLSFLLTQTTNGAGHLWPNKVSSYTLTPQYMLVPQRAKFSLQLQYSPKVSSTGLGYSRHANTVDF